MRKAIYTPVFEGPDQATVTAGIKAKTLQPTPSTACGTLVAMLSLFLGQAIYDVGQSTGDLGETEIPGMSTDYGKDPRQKTQAKRLSQLGIKGLYPVEVTGK